jgi:ankyrin repeat protein
MDATPLLRAAKGGDAAAVRLLLAHGADPNQMQANGVTPLMAAAKVGAGGADTRGPTPGRTAVEGASAWGWNEVVAALIELGARPPLAKPAMPAAAR